MLPRNSPGGIPRWGQAVVSGSISHRRGEVRVVVSSAAGRGWDCPENLLGLR